MRITSGKYKGRRLIGPKQIRPTQEKVRKALFDILGDIEGLSFLELFAGSGGVGFEAASRGVKDLTFVEYSPECQRAIRNNIQTLKLTFAQVYPLEAGAAIKAFHQEARIFDIVFLDPPYYRDLSKKTLQTLAAYDIVAAYGIVVAQHFKKDNLPDTAGDFVMFKQARYGDTLLSFYKRSSL